MGVLDHIHVAIDVSLIVLDEHSSSVSFAQELFAGVPEVLLEKCWQTSVN